MSKTHQVNFIGYFLFILLIVGLDQGVKFIAQGIIPTVHNNGIVFGLFTGYSFYFVLLGFIFLIEIIKKNHFSSSSALLIGGGIANLIDRLRFGYVVDYIDLKSLFTYIGIDNIRLPVFNIADLAITLGAILLIYNLLKKEKKNV